MHYLLDIFLLYSLVLFTIYILLVIISSVHVFTFERSSRLMKFENLINSKMMPGVTIIAPAYNEETSIVDCIESLRAMRYDTFEIIIVNDGSSDGSLDKVIEKYSLIKSEDIIDEKIQTKKIRGIYISTNPIYENIKIIDKENGGKSDALNAGINVSKYKYFLCMDVDSLLHPDTILSLMRYVLDEKQYRVIAVSALVRIVNSSQVTKGNIDEIHFPKSMLARFQIIEYARSFLIGRLAFGSVNALLLLSGAICLLDKEIVVKVKGYNTNIVGEDMELTLRIQKYMLENQLKYRIIQTPESLCWTEVPEKVSELIKQRDRWTRGSIETLSLHKSIFFNRKYKNIGMFGFPYWVLFEWLAAFVEFFGLIMLFYYWYTDKLNKEFTIVFIIFAYLFALFFSAFGILYYEIVCGKYTKVKNVISLCLLTFVEPIIYHPIVLYSSIKGNFNYFILQKRKKWDKLERKGFQKETE